MLDFLLTLNMSNRNRTRGDEDEVDVGAAEAELTKLQRQYRMAEGDRRSYTEESQNTIRKQKATLNQLIQDNDHLKQEIAAAEGTAASSQKANARQQELQARAESYQAEIESERQRCADLDNQLAAAKRELSSKRKDVAAATASDTSAVKKQATVLENRLEKALNKLNSTLTTNAKLREAIDHLKAERNIFDGIYKKLEKELMDEKQQMAGIIEKSNAAYESRDEAQGKITALKEKAEKEISQYNIELKDFTRLLEHDRKLKDFMGVKGQDRTKQALTTTRNRKPASTEKDGPPEDTIQTYEEAFKKLKEATGIQDTHKLVNKFIEVEDQNFSLFNFVNELNNEIETLHEQISDTKMQIEKFNKQDEAAERHRAKRLRDLEEKLAFVEGQSQKSQDRQAAILAEMETMKNGIASIFEKIGCNAATIHDVLGNSGISEANIMQYLGIIEQRTNELLLRQGKLDVKASESWEQRELELREIHPANEPFDPTAALGPKPTVGSLLGAGPQLPPVNEAIVINPPSTGDGDDPATSDEDDGGKPLSHEELRAKIIRGMNKPKSGRTPMQTTLREKSATRKKR